MGTCRARSLPSSKIIHKLLHAISLIDLEARESITNADGGRS